MKAGPRHLNRRVALLQRARNWTNLPLVTVMLSMILVSPAMAGTLTGVSVSVMSNQQGTAGNRINASFTTATGANPTANEVQIEVPAGADVSPGNRALLLSNTTNGNYASTPSSASNNLTTGDLDIRAKVAYPDWYSGITRHVISKRQSSQESFGLSISAINGLELALWSSGGTASYSYQPLPAGWAQGSVHWLRATHRISDGQQAFYVSDDGQNWNLLGTSSGPTSRRSSTSPVEIGAVGGAGVQPAAIHKVELRNQIDGPIKQVFDAADANPASPLSWNAPTGETWTVTRTGSAATRADIGGELSAIHVQGVPTGGRAQLRLSDDVARYMFPSPQVINGGTQVKLGLGGIEFDRSVSSWTPTIRLRDNTTDVDTAAAPAVSFQDTTVEAVAGNHNLVPTTDSSMLNFRMAPVGLATFGNYIYFSDINTYTIMRLDTTTNLVRRIAGNGLSGSAATGVPATSTGISYPSCLATDSAGNLYICEEWSNRVLRYNPGTGQMSVEVASITKPTGIAVDSSGNLIIAQRYENKVSKTSGGVGARTLSDLANVTAADSLAIAPNGDIYVSQLWNSTVSKIANGETTATVVAGSGYGNSGNGGQATSASFAATRGVYVDSSNNLYISDIANNNIRRVNLTTGIVAAFSGGPDNGFADGPRASALFNSPMAMVAHGADLLIADHYNGRIRKSDGTNISTITGSEPFALGQKSNARFMYPNAMATDSRGNLYMADAEMGMVTRIDPHDRVTAFAGTIGRQGYAGDGGPATSARLDSLSGLAIGPDDSVYISEAYAQRIRKVSPSGTITTFASSLPHYVYDIAMLPQNNANNPNNHVLLAALEDGRLVSIASNGTVHAYAGDPATRTTGGDGGGFAAATFNGIHSVDVANNGDIFITDAEEGRVRRISGGIISTVAGGGSDYSDNIAATAAILEHPSGVKAGPDGTVYVAEEWWSRIRVFKPGGKIFTIAGTSDVGDDGDGGPAQSATIGNVVSLAIRDGDLIFGDATSTRLRAVKNVAARKPHINNDSLSASSGILATLSPNSNDSDFGGYIDPTLTTVASGPTDGSLTTHTAITDDEITRFYYTANGGYTGTDTFSYRACDSTRALCANATVNITVGNGEVRTVTGGSTEGGGADGVPANHVAADDRFTYTIEDGRTIHRLDRFSGKYEWFAGNGTSFVSGDGGPATAAGIGGTNALTVGARGELYLLNSTAGTIRMIDTNGVITKVAGTKGGPTADGTATSAYDFTGAVDLAINLGSSYGAFLVAFPNKVVYIHIINNWAVVTEAGTGIAGSGGDGGPATAAQLNGVTDIAMNAKGGLHIADGGNHAIRALQNGNLITVAGTLGVSGNTGDGLLATSARLSSPSAISVSKEGTVAIADKGNNRVRTFYRFGNINAFAGSGASSGPRTDTTAAAARIASPISLAWNDTTSLSVVEGLDGTVRSTTNAQTRSAAYFSGQYMNQQFARLDPNSGDGVGVLNDHVFVNADPGRIANSVNNRVDFESVTGGATAAQNKIQGMATDPTTDDVYYTDTDARQVKKITSAGAITTVAGTGASGTTGDGGAATSATFIEPYGIARASDGTLYVTDRGAHKVRKITPGGNIFTFAGTGTAGYTGNSGPATSAQFDSPTGVAVDSMGTVYVADTANHAVRGIDRFGVVATIAGTGVAGSGSATFARDAQLNQPTSVVVGTDIDVYIGDNSGRITGVGTNNEFFLVAGNGVKGYVDNTSQVNSRIGRVVGMDFHDNKLYFLDRDAGRVRVAPIGSHTMVLDHASLQFVPAAPGHTSNQLMLTVKPNTAFDVQHIYVPLPGSSGSPSVSAAYGVTQTPVATVDSGSLHLDFSSVHNLRPGVTYAFIIDALEVSAFSPRQVEVSFLDGGWSLVAFARSNLIDTSGPGNMPAPGQAGFASPPRASSTVSVSGTGKVTLDPGATTSGSTTRSITSSGNLNGQRVDLFLNAMVNGTLTLPMLGNTGVAPAAQPSNTWGVGIGGGVGTPDARWAGGQLAGTTSGAAHAYFDLAVGSPFTISPHAKVDYLSPSGRYQANYTLSATRGH